MHVRTDSACAAAEHVEEIGGKNSQKDRGGGAASEMTNIEVRKVHPGLIALHLTPSLPPCAPVHGAVRGARL